MKKLIAFILCAMLMCTMVVAVHAEDNSTYIPTTVESAAQGENSGGVDAPEKTMTETIVDYLTEHVEEISVIGTLLLTIFYEIGKHGKLNGSIGTLNNNAITVAENSAKVIKDALSEVEDIANVVKGYKDEIAEILGDIRKSADEKKALEVTLSRVDALLSTSKLATIELANEVAELLCLANIPNAKKEELYSRHRAAIATIAEAENTEVKVDDNKEA